MYLLGYDLGSSSVKASLLDSEKGTCIASAFFPKFEMSIISHKPGWAEQDPSIWWENLVNATHEVMQTSGISPDAIAGIGISYQMHGLVLLGKNKEILRPSIIWCDSRAVEIGNKAFKDIGVEKCLSHLLNSPGNFTASKLKWVKENEPEIYSKIWKIMLPGDYIAFRMTSEAHTTSSGLSEGIFWDFASNNLSDEVLNYFGFDPQFIPEIVPTFSIQGKLSRSIAAELGLSADIPVAYRAGDQPNNAFSLNVLNPGEIAATAGTSGVVYGVSKNVKYDPQSRVNSFIHVNHEKNKPRLGVLLCINGTGILNSWIRKNIFENTDYKSLDKLAETVPAGCDGLNILPFGNGAERMLQNREIGCHFDNLNFNIHGKAHLARAAQEGIVFSFKYGLDIMQTLGIKPEVIRAGNANMFLSPLFRQMLSTISGAEIELYNTDGSQGAARGAGIGTGLYKTASDAFKTLEKLVTIKPEPSALALLNATYNSWLKNLERHLNI
jgi:xylulokinase